ncbi:alpha-tocopherol transfer protein [Drosophila guanche]|uniref:Blast:Alpha-tocopherol transfer protein n=1 Tax=Drosophila guanche TaxID=7266 RepID=A0A3B0JWJ0_DROGU|nr:alpha-tocopherol transfer protein [Drosophila guanche]SPP77726.1 blast:Alpha-tocopherol transfer protein [Drosophila guanche]
MVHKNQEKDEDQLMVQRVLELQDWIKQQSQLPPNISCMLLRRFLHTTRGDLAATQRLMEHNYGLRNKHAQIFIERDPLDASSQQLLQVADLVPLPGLTPENNKLLFYRLIDFDADKFNFTAGIKVFFMVADCRFATENDGRMSDGEIPIFDMAGYTLRHLTKTVLSSLRVYMKFVQEAHPVRLKEVHVLNCPSYLDKVLTVVKPFIKSEVFKLIHFHLPNAETPFKHFPRSMLPEEYGGQAGKMSELKQQWMQLLKEQRDYLMDGQNWQLNKAKKLSNSSSSNRRSSTSSTSHAASVAQSLKNLEID